MIIIGSIDELAEGHKPLAELLDDLASAFSRQEEEACKALIALTSPDSKQPITGQELWTKLVSLFPDKDEKEEGVNFFNLLQGISEKIQTVA